MWQKNRHPITDEVYEHTKKAIYVGDSEVDIQTAENTGLPCVSVMWGFRDAEFLRKNRAQVLIQRPLELLYLI